MCVHTLSQAMLGIIYCLNCEWQSYRLPVCSPPQGRPGNRVYSRWYGGCIKASAPVTGKGRAQEATIAERFLIKIVPIVRPKGS